MTFKLKMTYHGPYIRQIFLVPLPLFLEFFVVYMAKKSRENTTIMFYRSAKKGVFLKSMEEPHGGHVAKIGQIPKCR
jgi:hypothetical protein